MYYKKTGLPEEGDFLLCTVKKILYHSVFVILDEFENQEGMVHISEIAPGRIRNIRDYVVEGKKIVCKVLRVNKEKGHVDLSLRRVNLAARKNKNEEYKQNIKAEKIFEIIAKEMKVKVQEIFKEVGDKILAEYPTLFQGLQEISQGEETIFKELKIVPKYAKVVQKIVTERIKPPEVCIEGVLSLTSAEENGVEHIKKSIAEGLKQVIQKDVQVNINYLGAPRYGIEVKAQDYKAAETVLAKMINKIIAVLTKENGNAVFEKK